MRRRSMCAISSSTSRPSILTVPALGSIKRLTVLRTVVLPLPDPPTIARSSPRATENETASTAVTAPKRTVTASRAIASSGIARDHDLRRAGSSGVCDRTQPLRERDHRLDQRRRIDTPGRERGDRRQEGSAARAYDRQLVDHDRCGVDLDRTVERALQDERAAGAHERARDREALRRSRRLDREIEVAVDAHVFEHDARA